MDKLVVRSLDKIYPGNKKKDPTVALKDINLAIEEKEFAVIVGPSGCGKSTLLNIIGGLDHSTNGEVLSMPGSDTAFPSTRTSPFVE